MLKLCLLRELEQLGGVQQPSGLSAMLRASLEVFNHEPSGYPLLPSGEVPQMHAVAVIAADSIYPELPHAVRDFRADASSTATFISTSTAYGE